MTEQEKTKKPNTDEIATASKDIDIFAGYFGRLENPDPVLRTEAAGKGLTLYDEVDRDSHAGSVLQTRYLAVTGKEWDVLPGDESSGAEEVAEGVKEALKNCNFNQLCQELLQAVLYGFYTAEVMWGVRDNKIVPEKIRAKHPRRFCFSMEREPRLLTPNNMIDGEELPARKFIVFTYGSSDNPYGKGLGQKLWWPVWFKKHGIKFWLVFLEKFGMPTGVGKYPPGTDPAEQDKLLEAVNAIQSETGVTIPDNMVIELLEATRSGKVTHESLCEYMDRQVSKAVLGQTATTEGTPGKLGNEKAQEDVRQDILEADADLLCECLNETLVKWIVDFNYPNVTAYPGFTIRTEDEEDSNKLAERDKTLAETGIKLSKRYYQRAYGFEDEDFDLVAEYDAPEQVPDKSEFAKGEADLSPAATLDKLGAKALAEADMTSLIAPVEKLLAEVTSLEEFRDRLLAIAEDMDETALGDFMAKAMAAADLSGRFDVSIPP